MKKNLLTIALFSVYVMISCKKVSQQDSPKPKPVAKDTSILGGAVIPIGFTWEASRNINFTVNITDTRFLNAMHIITIYDGNPTSGGNLLSKGSATILSAFMAKLYISNQITQVYIVKTAPDGSNTTLIAQVGTADIIKSIGAN